MNLKLIVFDLDFTLWDCGGSWCDCMSPPFQYDNKRIFDQRGREVVLYPDVLSIIERLSIQEIPMAIASRTERPDWAMELIQMLKIVQFFSYKEIYPSSKLKHFKSLQEDSQIDYHEMLFFDDELRNIRDVSKLGVKCIHIDQGLTSEKLQEGLKMFRFT